MISYSCTDPAHQWHRHGGHFHVYPPEGIGFPRAELCPRYVEARKLDLAAAREQERITPSHRRDLDD